MRVTSELSGAGGGQDTAANSREPRAEQNGFERLSYESEGDEGVFFPNGKLPSPYGMLSSAEIFENEAEIERATGIQVDNIQDAGNFEFGIETLRSLISRGITSLRTIESEGGPPEEAARLRMQIRQYQKKIAEIAENIRKQQEEHIFQRPQSMSPENPQVSPAPENPKKEKGGVPFKDIDLSALSLGVLQEKLGKKKERREGIEKAHPGQTGGDDVRQKKNRLDDEIAALEKEVAVRNQAVSELEKPATEADLKSDQVGKIGFKDSDSNTGEFTLLSDDEVRGLSSEERAGYADRLVAEYARVGEAYSRKLLLKKSIFGEFSRGNEWKSEIEKEIEALKARSTQIEEQQTLIKEFEELPKNNGEELTQKTVEMFKSDLEARTLEAFKQRFGLLPEALNAVDKFKDLSSKQKLLVLNNISQLMRAQRAEEAEEAFAAERAANLSVAPEGADRLTKAKHWGVNLWRGFWDGVLKPFKIAEEERKAARASRESALRSEKEIPEQYRDMLTLLVDQASKIPTVEVAKDAEGRERIVPQYRAVFNGVPFENAEKSKEVLQALQAAALALEAIPREFSAVEASESQKRAYQDAKTQFQSAKSALLDLSFRSEGGRVAPMHTSAEMVTRVSQMEYQVEMQRLFNQYPEGEVEKAMLEMADVSSTKRVFRTLFRGISTTLSGLSGGAKRGSDHENVAYFAAGLAIRPAAAMGLGLAAAPFLGAGFGAWRGWRKAGAELNAQDKRQREMGKSSEQREYESLRRQIADVRERLEKNKTRMANAEAESKAIPINVSQNIQDDTRLLDDLLRKAAILREQGAQEGLRNMLSSDDAEAKLKRLTEDYGEAQDPEKKARLKARIQSRIDYTRRKLEEDLISFDGVKASSAASRAAVRARQKLDLITTMEKAQVAIAFDKDKSGYRVNIWKTPKNINDERVAGPPQHLGEKNVNWETEAARRLNAYLKKIEEGINGIRDEKRKEMAVKGVMMGLGFGLAGSSIRYLWDYGFSTEAYLKDASGVPDAVASPGGVLGRMDAAGLSGAREKLDIDMYSTPKAPLDPVLQPGYDPGKEMDKILSSHTNRADEKWFSHEIRPGADAPHHSIVGAIGEHMQGTSGDPYRKLLEFGRENGLTPQQMEQLNRIQDAKIEWGSDGEIKSITGHFAGPGHHEFAYGDTGAHEAAGAEGISEQAAKAEGVRMQKELRAEENARPGSGVLAAAIHGRVALPSDMSVAAEGSLQFTSEGVGVSDNSLSGIETGVSQLGMEQGLIDASAQEAILSKEAQATAVKSLLDDVWVASGIPNKSKFLEFLDQPIIDWTSDGNKLDAALGVGVAAGFTQLKKETDSIVGSEAKSERRESRLRWLMRRQGDIFRLPNGEQRRNGMKALERFRRQVRSARNTQRAGSNRA